MAGDSVVTFIIPARNSGATIERCLTSIRAQDYPADKIEIMLVDNGSHDDTIEIAKRFTQNIIRDSTATIARLRNLGAAQAGGDVFVFIDSDCVIDKDWLRTALAVSADPSVCLAGSRSYLLPESAGWIDKVWKKHLEGRKGGAAADWVGSIIMLVKKTAFVAVGGFDESLATCEDVDFSYRVKKVGRIASDDRLSPVHLGLFKGVSGFFKKEVWRGQDNLRVIFRYINTPAEWKGLLWLAYYAGLSVLLLIVTLAAMWTKEVSCIALCIAGLVGPIGIIVFDTCRKAGDFSIYWRLFFLYSVYTAARVTAMVPWKRK